MARPAPVPLRSFLPPWKASQCNAAGLLRQGPASLRSVLRSLDTRPAALATRRKEGRKDKTAEGQPLKRPSYPRSASFYSPSKGGRPGKAPHDGPSSHIPGREGQTRQGLFEIKIERKKATREIATPNGQSLQPSTTTERRQTMQHISPRRQGHIGAGSTGSWGSSSMTRATSSIWLQTRCACTWSPNGGGPRL